VFQIMPSEDASRTLKIKENPTEAIIALAV